ncbi:MAG: hypothetical protein PSV46_24135 [Reyranella sp.]|nr:hypothetical protein [Reyranella sp.]
MAPQPRVAPPPPPPPIPPPVMAPASPGMQPGAPASVAPRSGSTSDTNVPRSTVNELPRPADRPSVTTGGSTTKSPDTGSPPPQTSSPSPQNRAPAPTAGSTPGRVAPVAAPVAPTVDRSTAIASVSRGLLPARDVAVVTTDGSGGARTQVKTNDKGQFSFGPLSPGVRDVTFPIADLQRALSDGGTKKRLPSVTVSLVVPAMPGAAPRGNLVAHTYSRIDPNKDIRAKITIPKDGSGAIVDWGDGTPPINVVRQGWPIDVGKERRPVETIGTISFVPKFQKMQFFSPPPCEPWWQCVPPPPPDGDPPMDDPWTELPPETYPPPEDPIIEIVEIDDPPKVDPPQVDPPKVDPPRIDDKGKFDIGPLLGTRVINVSLPQSGKIVTDPPKPPVKVALLLPSEPRAAVEAMNAGGRPPLVRASDRLFLVEHIYAPDTTGQTLRVTVTVAKDGESALVDWGDGTPVTNVRRDGKPIAAASVDHEAIGRILFVEAKKK